MLPDYRADNPYQELLARALREQGMEVQFPVGYRRVFPITRALRDCEPRPNVVHLHWLAPYTKGNNLFTAIIYRLKLQTDLWLSRQLGARLVWTVHNLQPHESRYPKLDRWARRRLVRMVDVRIVHSEAARATCSQEYDVEIEKFVVIPHGHYRDYYGEPLEKAAARKLLALPQDKIVILCFGMIRPYKGVELLLEAWDLPPEKHLLLIAGQPADDATEARITEFARKPGIHLMLRRIEDNEIASVFSAADLAVFPFTGGLTSGSLLLALTYGLPVIGPDIPAFSEVRANSDGVLYSNEQHESLAVALKRACESDFGDRALRAQRVARQLSWGRIGVSTRAAFG